MKKEAMQTKTKVISLTALLVGATVFGMILAGSLDFTRPASADASAATPAPAAAASTAARPAVPGLPSFADIAERIEGRDISRVIRGVEQAALVNALAGARTGADAASAEFILANMSQRMAATLRDEMAERGKVREKDAEAAKKDGDAVKNDPAKPDA